SPPLAGSTTRALSRLPPRRRPRSAHLRRGLGRLPPRRRVGPADLDAQRLAFPDRGEQHRRRDTLRAGDGRSRPLRRARRVNGRRTLAQRTILAIAKSPAMLAEATPIAVDRYAEPEDIAPLLSFLAGPDLHYVVGQTIFIDGGKDVIRRGDAL